MTPYEDTYIVLIAGNHVSTQKWPKMAKNEKYLHRRYRRQPCPHMKPGCKYNNEAHSDQSSILDLGPPGPAALQIGDCCCLGPPGRPSSPGRLRRDCPP